MEANACDVNHLDADVLLPPRKRLLAGFKRQNSDIDATAAAASAAASHHHPPPVVFASSSSSASWSYPLPASPTPGSPSSVELRTCLNDFLSSHLNNCQKMSAEQIVEASKSAADAAVKAAEAARSAAQEKALFAAKTVAAAKGALALVSAFSGEGMAAGTSSRDTNLKKNKLKKHVQVQLLYKKHQPVENHGDDEELARKLHRVMNSSPRISKNSSGSVGKDHQNKRTKFSSSTGKTSLCNEGFNGIPGWTSNANVIASELHSEGSIRQVSSNKADEKASKFGSPSHVAAMNGEAESSHCRDKADGGAGSPSKKRGRLKLKKLPPSICDFRDHANFKEDLPSRGSPLTDKNMGNPTHLKPLFPIELSGDNLFEIGDAQNPGMPGVQGSCM